jgi:hypothetical protein
MHKFRFLVIYLLALASCINRTEHKFYGVRFDTTQAISVAQLNEKMKEQQRVDTVVTGNITAVCKAEGCWMNLKNESGEDLFVDWDHEFNIPMNSEGRTAFISGYAYFDTTSVDELKHIAKDDGKPQEEIDKITEPKLRVSFKATGVKL